MHIPSVSSELANEVRRSGGIEAKEFERLIVHWFPSAWSMFWTLQRKAFPASSKRKDEPTGKILRALLPGLSFLSRPSEPPPSSVSGIVEISLRGLLSDDGIKEVYEVMASDAMRRAGEMRHGLRYFLLDEDRLVGVAEGSRMPEFGSPNTEDVEKGYPRGCALLRKAVSDLGSHRDGLGFCHESPVGPARLELMLLMAIRPHRLVIEQQLGVHLAYQWPGIVAAAPRSDEKRLMRFRSSAEQILAIHKAST